MVTRVDVANMALSLLDEAPISSLEDNHKVARLINTHFETTREAELSLHSWVFAIFTEELTGTDLDTGSGTLNWEYSVPAGALRILPLTYDNTLHGVPISWEQRDGKLYSDQVSPRGVRYIGNLTDPDDWNALFTEAFAAALAVKIAYPLTHKTGMVQVAQQAYDRAISRARRVNAIERQARLYDASWAFQRGDTRYWRA
jgi:hypothetical protein